MFLQPTSVCIRDIYVYICTYLQFHQDQICLQYDAVLTADPNYNSRVHQ